MAVRGAEACRTRFGPDDPLTAEFSDLVRTWAEEPRTWFRQSPTPRAAKGDAAEVSFGAVAGPMGLVEPDPLKPRRGGHIVAKRGQRSGRPRLRLRGSRR